MDITFVFAGFLVGGVVGLTGVGGGALMTPFLILYGINPAVAVGTDLVYAALTKSAGLCFHHRQGTVQWRIVGLMALGSLPAALLAVLLLQVLDASGFNYEPLITTTLGISLILTSLVVLFRERLGWGGQAEPELDLRGSIPCRTGICTVAGGALLGTLVTLSSVGAGALGAAILMLLYPRLRTVSVVGTDLAHAALLAAASGLGHAHLGTVDFQIVGYLLVGSLPGIAVGTHLVKRLPEAVVRRALGTLLLSLGVGFSV